VHKMHGNFTSKMIVFPQYQIPKAKFLLMPQKNRASARFFYT